MGFLTKISVDILSILALATLALSQFPCQNTPTSRACWGEYNISTDWHSVVPDTGVTREVR
jgi:hypothetical protein